MKKADLGLIILYLAAIVAANWLVTTYGQVALPFTAICLIPFDLVIRDLLQDRWQNKSLNELRLRMGALIFGGALLSCSLFPASFRVSLASFIAFSLTGVVDAVTYQWMLRRYGRLIRINLATILGAAIDSVVFAFLAFDEVSGSLVLVQILAKSLGGFLWSLLLYKYFSRRRTTHGDGNPSVLTSNLGTDSPRVKDSVSSS